MVRVDELEPLKLSLNWLHFTLGPERGLRSLSVQAAFEVVAEPWPPGPGAGTEAPRFERP